MAKPWLAVVIPTPANPPGGRDPPARAQLAPPSAEVSMPWPVASSSRPDRLPDSEVAVPAVGAVPVRCQLRPPSPEEYTVPAGPPPDGPVHSSTRLAVPFTDSRAPDGCPPACGAPGRQGVLAGPAGPAAGQAAPVGGPLSRCPSGTSR